MAYINWNEKSTLTFSNQLDFKNWARKRGLTKKAGADYYFDGIFVVDGRDWDSQPNIENVVANGSLTFGKALARLKNYFNIA